MEVEGRSRFFYFFDIRPLRGGTGRRSNTICRFELDVPLFFAREATWGAPPWRCGAGFNSEVLLRARCPFFLWGSMGFFGVACDVLMCPELQKK